jgi:CPA1 family monovalent cation:H+ antiporter
LVEQLGVVFGLFVVLVVIATLARRIQVPYPILLVVGGLVIGLLPGLPTVELDPELVLLIFLPPLLYAAAIATPMRELRENLQPISLLAVGLVLATIAAVAATAHLAIPGMSWQVGFTLGAIVSPPDPVAATAIANRLGLPRRLVTILEAEGLFNDATALVAYRLAVAAVVTGSFSLAQVGVGFVLAAVGAVVLGLVVGWAGRLILGRLFDPPVENTVQLLIPFAAYVPAEALDFSGILAVLTAGLFLGRYGWGAITSAGRLQGQGLWDVLVFILEGLSFILIGLQLRPALAGLSNDRPLVGLVGEAALVTAVVIVVRIIWVFAAAQPSRMLGGRLAGRDPYPGWRRLGVLAWAGMRGVVSMAAALALPANFPQRDLLIFLTFVVIFVTLVGQGLTLPALIRRLEVVEPADRITVEEAQTRARIAQAALERLEELHHDLDVDDDRLEHLRHRYQHSIDHQQARRGGDHDQRDQQLAHLRHELLEAERAELLHLRDEPGISPAVFQRVLRDLDLEESRLDR